MNSSSKGTRLEREFEAYLIERGYITHRAKRTHFVANDIWGCHDIMARHKRRPDRLLYFQVSTAWRLSDREDCRTLLYGKFEQAYLVIRKDFSKVWMVRPLIHSKKEWGKPRPHKGEPL